MTGTFSLNFYVGNDLYSCDWRWPNSNVRQWSVSCKDGQQWYEAGPLSEEGRRVVLERFGLVTITGELPLATVRAMSPARLLKRRRALEKQNDLPQLDVNSDTMGSHFSALLAA